MRMITGQAGVNLAAINYHFGSKEVLIQETFVRFLDPLTRTLELELHELEASNRLTDLKVSDLLKTFVGAAMKINQRIPDGAALFVRLLGLSFAEPQQGYLRTFLSQRYSQILNRYKELFQKVLPQLPDTELFWRLHYMLGAAGFTLAGLDGLQKIASRDYGDDLSFELQVRRLVSFLAAGLSAPKFA